MAALVINHPLFSAKEMLKFHVQITSRTRTQQVSVEFFETAKSRPEFKTHLTLIVDDIRADKRVSRMKHHANPGTAQVPD